MLAILAIGDWALLCARTWIAGLACVSTGLGSRYTESSYKSAMLRLIYVWKGRWGGSMPRETGSRSFASCELVVPKFAAAH